MNIKQRRWLSSERKLFSLPLIFGPTLSQSIFTIHSSLTQLYPFICSLGIYNMMLVRETEPAQTKSINIPLACISLNILTMCYQSVASVSLHDLFCNVLRVSPAPQLHHHPKSALCTAVQLGAGGADTMGQRYFNGSNIWLLMTNTISPWFKFQIEP